MSEPVDLARVVLQWHELHEQLHQTTPEELCRDHPELLPEVMKRIEGLRQLEQQLRSSPSPTETVDYPVPPNANTPLETTDFQPEQEAALFFSRETAPLPPQGQTQDEPQGQAVEDETKPTLAKTLPRQIGSYEILGELGRGGMGVVYRARQAGLNREVALKMILHADHAGETERERFRTEAEAIARLQHPNIVQIHEIGDHHGTPFFSLEFVTGGSLADSLDGTPLPAKESARLVEVLARAMQLAHQENIIHRDLKPANVLMTSEGVPKITDFGLAKQLDQAGQTATGAVVGTPSYLAPEQASGQQLKVGPASDVYALGAILYECLTGRPPFKAGNVMDTLLQVVADDPVAPTHLHPKLPRDLETICLKCLEKEPSRRYASASELAADLQRFQNGEPIQARAVGRAEKVLKWSRRNPLVASLLALVAVLLLGGGISGTRLILDLRDAVKEKEGALTEQKAALLSETAALQAKSKALIQKDEALRGRTEQFNRAEAALVREQREHNRAVEHLLSARLRTIETIYRRDPSEARTQLHDYTACPIDHRDFAWHYYDAACRPELWQRSYLTQSATFSHDGKLVAVVRPENPHQPGSIDVLSAQKGKLIRSIPVRGAMSANFSPDDTQLVASGGASARGGFLRAWNLTTGEQTAALEDFTAPVRQVAHSSDGKKLVCLGTNTIVVCDAEKLTPVFELEAPRAHSFCVSPEGELIAARDETRRRILIWSLLKKGPPMATVPDPLTRFNSLAFSFDGKKLAACGVARGTGKPNSMVMIWGQSTPGKWAFSTGIPNLKAMPLSVAWSPDGRTLAFGDETGSIRIVDTGARKLLRTFRLSTEPVNFLQYGPGGDVLLSCEGRSRARLWDASIVPYVIVPKAHEQAFFGITLSANGKILVTGGHDRKVRVWNPVTQKMVSEWAAPTEGVTTALAIHPDGDTLAVSTGRHVELWSIAKQKRFAVLEGARRVTSLEFTQDGTTLVSCGTDTPILIWDVASRSVRRRIGFRQRIFNRFTKIRLHPDGKRVAATTSRFHALYVWDLQSGKELFHQENVVDAQGDFQFSPNGRWLACVRNNYARPRRVPMEIRLFEATTFELIHTLTESKQVGSIVFHPSEPSLFVETTEGIDVWNLSIFSKRGSVEVPLRQGGQSRVGGLIVHPDGRHLIARCDGTSLAFWSVRPPTCIANLSSQPGAGPTVVDPTGKLMARTVGMKPNHRLVVHSLKTGQIEKTLAIDKPPEREGESLPQATPTIPAVFTSDGKYLLTGTGTGNVLVWSTESWTTVNVLHAQGPVMALELSPDNSTLISAHFTSSLKRSEKGSSTVLVWDSDQWKRRRTLLSVPVRIDAIDLSSNGRDLAILDSDNQRALIWDVQTFTQKHTLQHDHPLHVVLFTPGGEQVITCSSWREKPPNSGERNVGEIRFWATRTGKEMGQPGPIPVSTRAVGVHPRKDLLLYYSPRRGGTVMMNLSTRDELAVLPTTGGTFTPDGKYLVSGRVVTDFGQLLEANRSSE